MKKILKYIAAIAAIMMSAQACTTYQMTAFQMQLAEGGKSIKQKCGGDVIPKKEIKNAEINDSTITVDVNGAKLIMWYKKN